MLKESISFHIRSQRAIHEITNMRLTFISYFYFGCYFPYRQCTTPEMYGYFSLSNVYYLFNSISFHFVHNKFMSFKLSDIHYFNFVIIIR